MKRRFKGKSRFLKKAWTSDVFWTMKNVEKRFWKSEIKFEIHNFFVLRQHFPKTNGSFSTCAFFSKKLCTFQQKNDPATMFSWTFFTWKKHKIQLQVYRLWRPLKTWKHVLKKNFFHFFQGLKMRGLKAWKKFKIFKGEKNFFCNCFFQSFQWQTCPPRCWKKIEKAALKCSK